MIKIICFTHDDVNYSITPPMVFELIQDVIDIITYNDEFGILAVGLTKGDVLRDIVECISSLHRVYTDTKDEEYTITGLAMRYHFLEVVKV